MTKTLIEALEELPTYEFNSFKGDIYYVKHDDLRAIIEQYKTEVAAHVISNTDRLPVDVRIAGGTVGKGCNFGTLMIRINAFNKFHDDNLANKDLQKEMRERLMKLTEPSPAIVGELVKALEDVVNANKFCSEPTVSDEHKQAKSDAHEEAHLNAVAVLARAKAMTE